MVQHRLTTTRTADLFPLGSSGQRSWELIRREAEQIGPRHAALFAEPFFSPTGDTIDWYASIRGPTARLDTLDGDARARADADLAALIGDISDRASAMRDAAGEQTRRLGEALANAVVHPGPDAVYMVGDQPVLTCWAYRPQAAAVPTGALTATEAARPQPAPEAAAAPEPVRSSTPPPAAPAPAVAAPAPPPSVDRTAPPQRPAYGWLWWLLWGATGAMALVLAWLVLPACGIAGLRGLDFCPVPTSTIYNPEADLAEINRNRLHQLQRELELAELSCRPAPLPPPEPEPEEPDEFDRRVQREGGETDAELKITLIWDTRNDLDLHVQCPRSGEPEIMFNRRTVCGGELDVDQNAGRGRVGDPVENVVFRQNPPTGEYIVRIKDFRNYTRAANNYRLRIQKGTEVIEHSGSLSRDGAVDEYRFRYP
ncbi:MAG: hypothetical protein AAF334_07540 [Pseudomonadota bacterium]